MDLKHISSKYTQAQVQTEYGLVNTLEKSLDIYIPNINNREVNSYEESKERAENYLKYIGAKFNIETNKYDYNGDIICTKENFLVYNGKLTIEFGYISGIFVCDEIELNNTYGLPYECSQFYLIGNNIKHLNYLPKSKIYVLHYNNIEIIDDYLFDINCIHIDLKNNSLFLLPINNQLNLEYFNCSYNNLLTLDNAPISEVYIASYNLLEYITHDKKLLHDNEMITIDISCNNLHSLEGLPLSRELIANNNMNLFSCKGIIDSNDKHINEQRNIDLGFTSIKNLDYLPSVVFELNISFSNIVNLESNTAHYIKNLYVYDCKYLKAKILERNYFILKAYTNNDTFLNNTYKVSKYIKNINNDDNYNIEHRFYNEKNNSIEHDILYNFGNEEKYLYDFFDYLVEGLKDEDYILKSFKWPEKFIYEVIIRYFNSLKVTKRYML